MRRHNALIAALSLFVGAGLIVAAGDDKDAVKKDMEALKGTWAIVSAEKDGKKYTEEQTKGVTLAFDGAGKTSVKKGDQVLFEGTIKIDPTKKPRVIDATQTAEGENTGKTFTGIYDSIWAIR